MIGLDICECLTEKKTCIFRTLVRVSCFLKSLNMAVICSLKPWCFEIKSDKKKGLDWKSFERETVISNFCLHFRYFPLLRFSTQVTVFMHNGFGQPVFFVYSWETSDVLT